MVKKEKRNVIKVYVEGGGDCNYLKTECREGFAKFFAAAGLAGKMPQIVACGTRHNAFDSFRTAIENGKTAVLLVDSEEAVSASHQQETESTQWKPWAHLKQRDNWDKPDNATDDDCHLMVQCMEAWLVADSVSLQNFFGQGFRDNQIPYFANRVESLPKDQTFSALANATKDCKPKGRYSKGSHSFKVLALVDPAKVANALPWAKRLIDCMLARMQ